MKTSERAACPWRISVEQLSTWHDGDLPRAETERLRVHIATCSACSAIVADYATIAQTFQRDSANVLHDQRQQDHLWHDLRAKILEPHGRNAMRFPQPRIWQAVAAVVIIATLVAAYFHFNATSSTRIAVAIDARTLPTAMQAWGEQSISKSIPLGKSAAFAPTDIAPDGTFVVGYNANTIEMLTVATGKLQTIFTADQPQATAISTVMTDGRYIAWAYQITHGSNATYQLLVFDLQQAKTTIIVTSQELRLQIIAMHNGILLWEQTAILVDANPITTLQKTILATDALQSLVQQPNLTIATAPSWPWMIYDLPGTCQEPNFHLLNIETKVDRQLPMLNLTPRQGNSNSTVCVVEGGLIYVTFLSGTSLFLQMVHHRGYPDVPIYQLAHADKAGASWQLYQTLTNIYGMLVGINDRLIVILGKTLNAKNIANNFMVLDVWDRVQQRFIQIDTSTQFTVVVVKNAWLLYEAGDNTLNLIDTSQLPTH